LDTKRKVGNTR